MVRLVHLLCSNTTSNVAMIILSCTVWDLDQSWKFMLQMRGHGLYFKVPLEIDLQTLQYKHTFFSKLDSFFFLFFSPFFVSLDFSEKVRWPWFTCFLCIGISTHIHSSTINRAMILNFAADCLMFQTCSFRLPIVTN